MKSRVAVSLIGFTLCLACSDNNNGSQNGVTFDPNNQTQGMTTGHDMGGEDMPVLEDAEVTDDAGDLGVAVEGFMHGTWLVNRVSSAQQVATLQVRHEAGETSLSGTFEMTEPVASGNLGGTNWLDNTFTTSWTVQVDGLDERFGLAMCTSTGSDDELGCRLSDPLSGDVEDAVMIRQ